MRALTFDRCVMLALLVVVVWFGWNEMQAANAQPVFTIDPPCTVRHGK